MKQHATITHENGFYGYKNGTTSEMDVLGIFLATDVGCSTNEEWPSFKDWALADKNDPNSRFNYTIGGNATFLEEDDNGDIHLVDDTGSDPDDIYYTPARIKMTREQFVQLLDDWQELVCKHKPKEVIILYDNDRFSIQTKN